MVSPKPWRAEFVVYFGIALFTCICSGALISAGLKHLQVRGFLELDAFGTIFVSTFTFQGMAWPLLWLFLKVHQVRVADAFGFRNPRFLRAMAVAFVTFGGILPVAWLLQAACVDLLTKLGHPPQNQFAIQLLESVKSPWSRGYLAFFAVVLAPVAEEFIFRGVLYPFVKQLGWPKLAFVSTSFLFALIHFDAATFVPLFVLALTLTWLYEFTDVLLAPILVHMLFNAANLIMLVLQHLGYVPASP